MMPRELPKALARSLFRMGTALAYVTYRAEGINALLLLMPAKLIVPTLRRHGAVIGEGVQIHSPLIIHNASPEPGKHYSNLIIGDHCYIGRDVFLDLKDKVILGNYVTVSMRCTLLTHTDAGERPQELHVLSSTTAPIRIDTGAYLGACCTILEGVTVGTKSVVAASALVRHDVKPEETVAGVPGRVVRSLK